MIPTTNIPTSIVTRDVANLADQTGNVYESVAIVSKRANQIATRLKQELNEKLAEFATNADNLEEVFENREQIEVSKQYERMPKATAIAMEEFLAHDLHFHTLTPEEEQVAQEAAAARAAERPARRM